MRTKKHNCILIQANGNNSRLGNFFKQPKHELFFGEKRIIERIIDECRETDLDIFICLRIGVNLNFNTEGCTIIRCEQTFNRIDTLEQCFLHFKNYDSVLILDSDVIIKANVLKRMADNCIAIGQYKNDGKKYGFVKVDPVFKYISGNEKQNQESHITIGAYCVRYNEFVKYLASKSDRQNESLLNYYNQYRPGLVFSDTHIVLGDIESYVNQLNNNI
jgi:choline kinase